VGLEFGAAIAPDVEVFVVGVVSGGALSDVVVVAPAD
jgi:hypothetical protein